MSRETSPYVRDPFWLDKRRDGASPHIWQIARYERGQVLYSSTRKRELADAVEVMDARIEEQISKRKGQQPAEALAAAHIVNYWKEKGKKAVNHDQTGRSLRTFLAFLMRDESGVEAVITDMTPALFERFREWRMAPHAFSMDWFGETYDYSTAKGVSGATVQRNINDVRAAVNYAVANARIPMAPKIKDVEKRYRSASKSRILTLDELARILWYAKHSKDMFRFVALQMVTSVRPMAALQFDPEHQYDDRAGLIDLQPDEAPQTKKRNAIIPAIRPMRVVLRAWAKDGATPVKSRKTAWRNMRRVLGLSADVDPKTIRYTIATWLYEMEWVPERQISEMLGHVEEGGRGLARTSRIYAKYRPENMGKVVKALTMIWLQVRKAANQYGSDHYLTSGQKGDKFRVVEKGAKC